MSRHVELTPDLLDLHVRLRSEGKSIAETCKIAGHGVSVYYRWKREAEDLIRHRELFAELVEAMGGRERVNEWLASEGFEGLAPITTIDPERTPHRRSVKKAVFPRGGPPVRRGYRPSRAALEQDTGAPRREEKA